MKFFAVFTACCVPILSAKFIDSPSISLPIIDFNELVAYDVSTALATADYLASIGAIQIVNIPNFESARFTALGNFGACLEKDPNARTMTMGDGSTRSTIAAGVVNGITQPMISSCGVASAKLRSLVSAASHQLFQALDEFIASTNRKKDNSAVNSQPLMEPYVTFDDIIRSGEHLEHFHAYYGNDVANHEDSVSYAPATLDIHTDAGLFIAMTTGFYSVGDVHIKSNNGLYIQTPSGSIANVVARDDALIIMVGEGGARWLNPVLGTPLRAVPHALMAGLPSGHTRAWYGKMFLPPADALMPLPDSISNSPQATANSPKNQAGASVPGSIGARLTYAEYRDLLHTARAPPLSSSSPAISSSVTAFEEKSMLALDDRYLSHVLPLACGIEPMDASSYRELIAMKGGRGRQLQDQCSGEPGTIWCWAKCQPISDLPCSNPVCVDTTTNEPTDPDLHCGSACQPGCVAEGGNASVTFNGYCYGTGVSMYMVGFKSSAAEDGKDVECVNLLFPEWTLDSPWKLGLAWVGVFVLGLVVQALTRARTWYFQQKRTPLQPLGVLFLYGAQVVLSYFLMLVAMTYNVELFCAVCAGLVAGYYLFLLDLPPPQSVDPCCSAENSIKDEANAMLLHKDQFLGSSMEAETKEFNGDGANISFHSSHPPSPVHSPQAVVVQSHGSCCGDYQED